jgi:hypothetical protein
MRKPPSGYSTDVAIPLPTDEQLGAETVAKLKLANDPQVRKGQDIRKIACVENQYNLVHRGDDPLIDALAKNGTAYVPFFSLGGLSPPSLLRCRMSPPLWARPLCRSRSPGCCSGRPTSC